LTNGGGGVMLKSSKGGLKKIMKKVLTQEEKAERKLIKRYTLCRFSKLVTIILIAAFIGCTLCFGLGLRGLNTGTTTTHEGGLSIGMTILLAIGGIGWAVIPFFIFRRCSLAFTLMGVGFWDVGVALPGMALQGENWALGGALVFFGVIGLLLAERRRNKKVANYKLRANEEFIENVFLSADADRLTEALDYASGVETAYKGSLYFALSFMLVAMTGIGLVLPFGKWAYSYNKYLFFVSSDWDPATEEIVNTKFKGKKFKQNRPYTYLLDGLIFVNEKPFYAAKTNEKCNYPLRAWASYTFSAVYLFIFSMISEINMKKASFVSKMDTTLGEFVFSAKYMAEKDEECAQLFVDYAKSQSAENRRDLLEGLKNWFEESQRANREELARIEREQEERDRFNKVGATKANVYVDDEGLYAEGYDAEGTKKQYKLDEYDEATGVGTYTDESGKKVKIKNTKE